MAEIEIVKATKDTGVSLDEIHVLLEQLSSSEVVFGREDFLRLVESDSSALYLLYVEGTLAGMLTLCSYLCPTGRKCWIEDVVVGHPYRGMGLGRRLIEHAIEETRKMGRCTLMLTSRPARLAANHLYQSAGFEQRETNVYRMKIKE